ncbi:hypothetical protein AAVH_40428, partial [Aphelenchoides avenae]
KYNTELEWYARRWASKCQPKYRFKDVHNVLGNIYYHQTGKLERGKFKPTFRRNEPTYSRKSAAEPGRWLLDAAEGTRD